jgi:hypothetical protein
MLGSHALFKAKSSFLSVLDTCSWGLGAQQGGFGALFLRSGDAEACYQGYTIGP